MLVVIATAKAAKAGDSRNVWKTAMGMTLSRGMALSRSRTLGIAVSLSLVVSIRLRLAIALVMALAVSGPSSVSMMAFGMILASSYTLSAENVIQARSSTRSGMGPILHCFEHSSVSLVIPVPQGWVMEDANTVVQHLFDWNVHVLPCVKDAGDNIF